MTTTLVDGEVAGLVVSSVVLAQAGEACRAAGDWPAAAELLTEALRLADEATGASLLTAATAQQLAIVGKHLGRFDEAEALHRRALAIAEATGDVELVAAVCHNLGGLAHARGDHAAGIPWARRSVEARALLDDDLGLAADRGALAALLLEVGELDEAEELLLAVRETFVEHLGPVHHEVGVVDGNLAAVALRRGQLDEAERRGRSALGIKEAALGSTSPELAPTLTTLGTIRRRRGDAESAVRLHGRALRVLQPVAEPDHPLLATIKRNLDLALDDLP